MLLRAEKVSAVSRTRFSRALHGNTQRTKTAWQRRQRAINHAATYGGKTKLLITVKLVDRKMPGLAERRPTPERGRILSETNQACQAEKLKILGLFTANGLRSRLAVRAATPFTTIRIYFPAPATFALGAPRRSNSFSR